MIDWEYEMQVARFPDGHTETQIIEGVSEEDLKQRLKEEYQNAMDRNAEMVYQSVLEPDLSCPCGSGRKTKNCCLKRLRSQSHRREERLEKERKEK